MNLNKVQVIGRITRDPEMRSLPNSGQVTSFSLATNRTYKDKSGNKKEDTEFINCVAFGKQAEIIAQYVRKGSLFFIEGRLKTQSWEKDGVKHYKTEVVVDNFQFGPKTAGEERAPRKESTAGAEDTGLGYPEEEINPDDIPF